MHTPEFKCYYLHVVAKGGRPVNAMRIRIIGAFGSMRKCLPHYGVRNEDHQQKGFYPY